MLNIYPILMSTPATDWLRLFLVYFHLVCCAFALALVLNADWRILKGHFTIKWMRRMAHNTSTVLVLLWVSGGLLVYHDTGLDLALMAGMVKLQFKLITVIALTLNGYLLHTISFPIMIKNRKKTLMESLLLSITGALSTSHWLLAAFVGIARPLQEWPMETLLTAYSLYVGATLSFAILLAPLMKSHLNKCFTARLNTRFDTSESKPHSLVDIELQKQKSEKLPIRRLRERSIAMVSN